MKFKSLQFGKAMRAILFVLLLSAMGIMKTYAQYYQHISYGIISYDPPEAIVLGHDGWYNSGLCWIQFPQYYLNYIAQPFSVVGVYSLAFFGNTHIIEATFPSTMRTISGFQNCTELKTININSNVDFTIGGFSGCTKLSSVNISNLFCLTQIESSAFSNCTALTIFGLSNATGLTTIGENAFSDCSHLWSITIPRNVTMIYNSAFKNCSVLSTMYYDAINCTSVMASSTQSTFDPNNHWLKNTSIHNLSIGSQVQSIPDYAFYDCSQITSITVNAVNPPTLGSDVFYNVNKNIPIMVPCGSENAYRNAAGWSEFINILDSSYEISAMAIPSEGGTLTGTGIYCAESSCTLTATANSGYLFTNWTENGEVVSTDASYSFTVTGDRNLVANFSINSYNISASINPTNGGTITGTGNYNYGETATLTATSNEGYTFTDWTENGTVVSTSVEYSFAVTGNRNLVANFSLNNYFISVAANPSNGGTVTGSGTYNHGATANLTATASNNYVFSNWTENGNVVSTDANYSFTVIGVRSLVANFTSTLVSYTVTATANPTGGGMVSGMGTYDEGATCTLTATANTGYTFTNWTENDYIVSTNANCSFTVTNNRNLVANFTLNTYYIATLVNPTDGGTVTGAGNYDYGTTATLTATANNGYSFLNWTENGNVVSTSANYSFTVTGTRNLVANFSLNTYTVSAAANPSAGGTVSGMGTFNFGETASLTATANEGYTFASWTENGTVVSTNANYNFEVMGDRSLVANFSPNIYTISVSANPTSGGSAVGGGTYAYGTTCTLTAVANAEYAFINWTENGTIVSTNSTYSFTVSENRALVANYSYVGIEGQLSGSFSVSDNTQISFSQGNLQYKASTDTWRFAEHQWDWVGGTVQGVHYGNVTNGSNSNISETYDGWIDLFGWGTSGWDNGNTYYHPWDSEYGDHSLYGPLGLHSLVGEYANADWGVYNPISNGGNQVNQWRSLTYGEWLYLLNSRTTLSGVRYAKAKVNDVNGLIVLPDNWETSNYELQNTNAAESSFDSNEISLDIWENVFESNGAVFLPAAGSRYYGTTLFFLNTKAMYWSATHHGNNENCAVNFGISDDALSYYSGYRSTGLSVRLVRTTPEIVSYSINAIALPTEGGTVAGAGNYVQGSTCILTATANEGYTFTNWTKNGEVVSANPNYSFTVSETGTYVANFQLNSYQVTATVNPTAGGNITGAGTYNHFETCTLTATANQGYTFVNWNENGQEVSTNSTYSFVVTDARTLEAVFTLNSSYDITATVNPVEGGTVTGWGTYYQNTTCTLIATANEGYTFTNWTENGETVSTNATYSFEVTRARNLVANFVVQGPTTNHWTPVASGVYSNSTTIHGVILIDGVEQYTNQLELGVFCGEECRGTSRPEEFFITHRYIASVNVFGENGNELTFRLFDHGLGQELDLTPPASVVFTDDGLGNPVEPYVLNFISTVTVSASVNPEGAGTVEGTGEYGLGETCTLVATANAGFQFKNWTLDGNVVSSEPTFAFTVTGAASYVAHFNTVQNTDLIEGWNWYSTYIEQEGINGLTMLENSLGGAGIRIQAQIGSTDYFVYQGTGYWYGALNTLTNEQMYKIRTNAACETEIVGEVALLENHPITIGNGWNWIGFPCNQSIGVDEAMNGFTPEANDIIKGRSSSTTYISYGGYNLWYGQLNTFEPGQGYMYKSNSSEPKTLVFQTGRGNEPLKPNITPEDNTFVPAGENYADNMLVTAVIEINGEELRSEDYELAAFVGDECRGSVKPMYIEPFDRYVAFLLVFGEANEEMHFVLTNGTEVSLSDDLIRYETDGTTGTLTEPVTLHFGTLGVEDGLQLPVNIYPNPSKGVFNIESVGIRKVEVVDAYGQVIFSEDVKNDCLQIDLGDKAAGAYLLRVVTDRGVVTKKLVLVR